MRLGVGCFLRLLGGGRGEEGDGDGADGDRRGDDPETIVVERGPHREAVRPGWGWGHGEGQGEGSGERGAHREAV